MKKKILTAGLAFLMSASFFSCGNKETSSTSVEDAPSTESVTNDVLMSCDEDEYIASLSSEELNAFIGSGIEIDYRDFIEDEDFIEFLELYTLGDRYARLPNEDGVPENPVVVKPYREIIVDERIEPAPFRGWMFPIVDNGRCVALLGAVCDPDGTNPGYVNGISYSDDINKALEKGRFVVFSQIATGNTYAIFEDNEIIPIHNSKPYNSIDVTFEELSSFGYVIDENTFSDVIYNIDDIVFNN